MTDKLVADTSFLVNFFNGRAEAMEYLEGKSVWLSGVVEIELLSSSTLTSQNRKLIKAFISQTFVVDLLPAIKEIAIDLRVRHKLKLSDAVVAATSIYLYTPLYTYDKDFKRLQNEADIVLIL